VNADARRRLPPVAAVLEQDALADAVVRHGRKAVRHAVREVLEDARSRMAVDPGISVECVEIARRSRERMDRTGPRLRPVINATGILLHTGLGRAPLAESAVHSVAAVAVGYSNLEFDLETGTRGRRTSGVAEILRQLTGAEAAFVVNNNAAATVLALRALAAGQEVIVSRGQLVEIGGSFRLPEIFEVSGARLKEVGTTNKTRLLDYQQAISPNTSAILRVHPSNYRIVGFTEQPDLAELVALGHEHGLVVIDDIGSGALGPGMPPGVADEPTVAAGLAAGADLVLFSGDKLLGGPQCGIMVGSHSAIARVESDPLARALRVDKMTIAALEATLRLALDPHLGAERIPLWNMIKIPVAELMLRAESLADALRQQCGWNAVAAESESFIGGGSAPIHPVKTAVVAVSPPFPAASDTVASWAASLRTASPPVVARVHKNQLIFDLRSVPPESDAAVLEAVKSQVSERLDHKNANGQVAHS
jgi:L-seryl-tRNA(Ser) seleniumtransferase